MDGFTVNGKQYKMLDADTLTFAEARAVEKVTGHSFNQLSDPAIGGSLSVTQALLWVSMKRSEPTMKFADLDDIPVGSFDWVDDEDDAEPVEGGEPDPTGADEATSTPSA